MNTSGNLFFLVVARLAVSGYLILACSLFLMSYDNFSYYLFSCVSPSEIEPFLATPTSSRIVEDLCKLSPKEKRRVSWQLILTWKLFLDSTPSKQKVGKVATGAEGD